MSETAVLSGARTGARFRPLWRLPGIAFREWRARPGRPRTPEPMVMDEAESVARFHEGARVGFGLRAVYDFSARALNALVPENGHLLDLGVGSGQALAWFLERRPDVTATGVDLSIRMLETARRLFAERGVASRVRLVMGDVTKLSTELTTPRIDAVSSVWVLHHMPDRVALGGVLRQVAALRRRHGSAVWLFDFQRMKNPATFRDGLAVTEPLMHPILAADGIASEAAAFTRAEMNRELEAAGLGDLRSGEASPVPWMQAFWSPGRNGSPGRSSWSEIWVPDLPRLDVLALRLGFSARPF